MEQVMIRGFGLLAPTTPPTPAAPTTVAPPSAVTKMVADNPLVAAGLILGGAYLAYKTGSLVGGVLAGAAALIYGPKVLGAMVAQTPAAAKTVGDQHICIDNCWDDMLDWERQPTDPVQPPVNETQATCRAKGKMWMPIGNGGMCWDGQIANTGSVVK